MTAKLQGARSARAFSCLTSQPRVDFQTQPDSETTGGRAGRRACHKRRKPTANPLAFAANTYGRARLSARPVCTSRAIPPEEANPRTRAGRASWWRPATEGAPGEL